MTTSAILNSAYPTVGAGYVVTSGRQGKLTFKVKLSTSNPSAVRNFAFVDVKSGDAIYIGTAGPGGLAKRLGSLEAHPQNNANLYSRLVPYLGNEIIVLDCTSAGTPSAATRLSIIGEYGSRGNAPAKVTVAIGATDHTAVAVPAVPAPLALAETVDTLADGYAAFPVVGAVAAELDATDAGDLPDGSVDASGAVVVVASPAETVDASPAETVATVAKVAKVGKRK